MKLFLSTFLTSIAFASAKIRNGGGVVNSNENNNNNNNRPQSPSRTSQNTNSSSDIGAVYTMTNGVGLLGNAVVIYRRSQDGTLTRAGVADTGGLGSVAAADDVGNLTPPPVDDPLGSQGGLILSENNKCLMAVNAGSDTFSVFRVIADNLFLERVAIMDTRGSFPVSIAQSGNLVYVLNAGGSGSVAGFRFEEDNNCQVSYIRGSNTELGNDLTNPPFFVLSPGQVGFDPTGRFLIVTNKGQNQFITFPVIGRGNGSSKLRRGRLGKPVITDAVGTIPFSFAFDDNGNLLNTEAFGSADVGTFNMAAVTSYKLNGRDGSLAAIAGSENVGNGQTAACWIAHFDGYAFVSNNLSLTLSSYRIDANGNVKLVEAIAADGDDGAIAEPLDLAITKNGRYLYVLNAHNTGSSTEAVPTTISIFKQEDGKLEFLADTTGLNSVTPGSLVEGPAGIAVI